MVSYTCARDVELELDRLKALKEEAEARGDDAAAIELEIEKSIVQIQYIPCKKKREAARQGMEVQKKVQLKQQDLLKAAQSGDFTTLQRLSKEITELTEQSKVGQTMQSIMSVDSEFYSTMFETFKSAVAADPMRLPDDFTMMNVSFMMGNAIQNDLESTRQLLAQLLQLLRQAFADGVPTMHPMTMNALSLHFSLTNANREEESERVACTVVDILSEAGEGPLPPQRHRFGKFLLCWNYFSTMEQKWCDMIREAAVQVMEGLSPILHDEYRRLEESKSPLLTLPEFSKGVTNRELLRGLLEGYTPFDAITEAEQEHMQGVFTAHGLPVVAWADRFGRIFGWDMVALELVNQVAVRLNPAFQRRMREHYEENCRAAGIPAEEGCFLEAPVKSRARQTTKVLHDYRLSDDPRIMSVPDVVRCAVVCKTDSELASMCSRFVEEEEVVRVKNGFAPTAKHSHGYRAVLLNIVFGDGDLKIVTEVQVLLQSYYEVRKRMHLPYSILRAESAQAMATQSL